MNVRPTGSRVVIEPCAEREFTEGGIVLPHGDKKAAREAVVRAVPDGSELHRGARVLYDRRSQTTPVGDGLLLIEGGDILAVYEGG